MPKRKARVDKLDVIHRHLIKNEPLQNIANSYGVTLRTVQTALKTGLAKMDFHSVPMLRGMAFRLTAMMGQFMPDAMEGMEGVEHDVQYRGMAADKVKNLGELLLKVLTRLDELDELKSGEPTTKERAMARALVESVYAEWGYDPNN